MANVYSNLFIIGFINLKKADSGNVVFVGNAAFAVGICFIFQLLWFIVHHNVK